MRVLKALAVVLLGVLLGAIVCFAAAVFLGFACVAMAGPYSASRHLIAPGIWLAVEIGATSGGMWAYRLFCHLPKTENHNPLTPDAERDARAHFLPGSDKVIEDDAIQHDKRGLKTGDR